MADAAKERFLTQLVCKQQFHWTKCQNIQLLKSLSNALGMQAAFLLDKASKVATIKKCMYFCKFNMTSVTIDNDQIDVIHWTGMLKWHEIAVPSYFRLWL